MSQINKDYGRAPSGQALAVPATPANAVDGPTGFDPSRWAGKLLVRCSGFACKHDPGTCTADPEYQRYIAWKRGEDDANKERVLQWPVERGYVRLTFPAGISLQDVEDATEAITITLRTMRERAASGTEARRAETLQDGSVHDGPTAAGGDAQQQEPTP